jgi:lipid-binding SYLF domain-containing protein
MSKFIGWAAAACVSLAVAAPLALADEVSSADVKKTIAAFEFKDSSMKERFKSAYAYAVFPNLEKGGVVLAAGGGYGQVFERGKPIGTAKVTQITVGATVGAQSYSEVIFFQDKTALDRFRANKLEFDANASAVISNSGASASADYRNGVVVFTMAKEGVMVEAAIGGQKFEFTPKGM